MDLERSKIWKTTRGIKALQRTPQRSEKGHLRICKCMLFLEWARLVRYERILSPSLEVTVAERVDRERSSWLEKEINAMSATQLCVSNMGKNIRFLR